MLRFLLCYVHLTTPGGIHTAAPFYRGGEKRERQVTCPEPHIHSGTVLGFDATVSHSKAHVVKLVRKKGD